MHNTNASISTPLRDRFGKDLIAVLFDMDGVLYDSMPNHAYSWSHAAEKFGLHLSLEEVYMNEGRTGAGTINELAQRYWGRNATEEEIQDIYKTKSELFNSCPKAGAMPGALDLLNKVREAGLMRVIVTGSGQLSLLDRLNNSFPGIFSKELMVTAFDVVQGKPFPEPYLKGLQKAGTVINKDGSSLRPEQAIVIENAPLGVQAAKAAGIYTIAVNTGVLSDQILIDAGADEVYSSMKALAEAF